MVAFQNFRGDDVETNLGQLIGNPGDIIGIGRNRFDLDVIPAVDELLYSDSVCCGNCRDHVTHIGVSRRVTDLLLHYDGKNSQQTL